MRHDPMKCNRTRIEDVEIMKRIDRIRNGIVSKVMQTDGWLDADDDRVEQHDFGHHASQLIGRHKVDMNGERHRQIVERLLDLSIRDIK